MVQGQSLNSYCAANGIDRIDLLKLDIQGGELAALCGAANLLERAAVKVLISEVEFVELYEGQPLFCSIVGFLARYGYGLYALPKLVPDELGQLCWADAVFCHDAILSDARAQLTQAAPLRQA